MGKGWQGVGEDRAAGGSPPEQGAGGAVPSTRGDARSRAQPAATVINGKFRVLGERQLVHDELSCKALHLGTGRRVELRLLPPGVSSSGPEADRMLRAARAAGRAPHSNVLNVVDSGLDAEQRPFVVYEQFAGAPASELVDRNGPCELGLACEIVSQVLDGLSALHARSVFHRQLRPEHVLVDGVAEELRVKLVGLGYSVVQGRDAEAPELPRGYSRYLAPEARRGEATATALVDVYATGVLLRYLVTGDTSPEAALPPALERAVARATAEDPDERFSTAEQFRACLSAIAGPSTRESLLPSGSLLSDLRFMVQRRDALRDADSSVEFAFEPEPEDGKLELYAVLLVVESLYAKVGAEGWTSLRSELPAIEQLLPSSGMSDRLSRDGVARPLVTDMLAAADQQAGRGNLRLVVELGELLAQRGLRRLCKALPGQLTPECLVACVHVLWRSFARDGEVVLLEQRDGVARLSVRGQRGASLELSALFAAMLRGQLALLSPAGEANLVACQALGDGADVIALSW